MNLQPPDNPDVSQEECINNLEAELAALKQELKALREQKPVKDAYIDEFGWSVGKSFIASERAIPDSWKPLYAAPVPASEGYSVIGWLRCEGDKSHYIDLPSQASPTDLTLYAKVQKFP